MSRVEFVVLLSDGNKGTVGFGDLEVIPRVGECVFYDVLGNEEGMIFKVKGVIHRVDPKGPPIVMMKLIDYKSQVI